MSGISDRQSGQGRRWCRSTNTGRPSARTPARPALGGRPAFAIDAGCRRTAEYRLRLRELREKKPARKGQAGGLQCAAIRAIRQPGPDITESTWKRKRRCLQYACGVESTFPSNENLSHLYSQVLFSRESVEHRDDWQSIVLVVKESAAGERSGDRGLPPENTFAASVRSFHHHAI